MNLVIDDAVEVKQATKTDEEKRRELGVKILKCHPFGATAKVGARSNSVKGR